ncbi:4Fe-4S dicluster domain-containing protein [Natronohydrobacter thiooxidans]|jgi:formate dehydrogenase iron-sulfur subunit|uniref:4Fe-4S dicluster domain-containing protein n=1 Tax=Natronohydrobacter thiooxidans TaxID=87172 RepID=UPI0008FF12C9|nr:4Fe-4S dicluster domain-containing protein [Natronohydrobacter thiooxidans]
MSFDLPRTRESVQGDAIEPGRAYGFFTDTTLCIGCKACEVACKEWNQLPAEQEAMSGMSYDNTRELSATTWRHVAFVEQMDGAAGNADPRWLMMSDVCKHCDPAPCLEACPTGAIFRTEFDSVVVQQDVCNGCGYCVPACPFGVVDVDEVDGKAHKCTLCYDRLKGGREPACAQVCPTDSIQFGPLDELIDRAHERTRALHDRGETDAYLYGVPDSPGATGGIEKLNAFFLLCDRPEIYNLPAAPTLPSRRIAPAFGASLAAFAGLAIAAAALLGGGRR